MMENATPTNQAAIIELNELTPVAQERVTNLCMILDNLLPSLGPAEKTTPRVIVYDEKTTHRTGVCLSNDLDDTILFPATWVHAKTVNGTHVDSAITELLIDRAIADVGDLWQHMVDGQHCRSAVDAVDAVIAVAFDRTRVGS